MFQQVNVQVIHLGLCQSQPLKICPDFHACLKASSLSSVMQSSINASSVSVTVAYWAWPSQKGKCGTSFWRVFLPFRWISISANSILIAKHELRKRLGFATDRPLIADIRPGRHCSSCNRPIMVSEIIIVLTLYCIRSRARARSAISRGIKSTIHRLQSEIRYDSAQDAQFPQIPEASYLQEDCCGQ